MQHTKKRIWDLPIRLTHWGLVFSFFGAFFTSELNPLIIHETFAFACLTLVLFRVFWGLLGSDTARFTQFVTGIAPIKSYLSELKQLRHKEFWGHNPVGALAVIAILSLMITLVSAGLFAREASFYGPWAASVSRSTSELLKDTHEVLANWLMVIVVVHIIAILAYRFVLKDNLIKPMITGVRPTDSDTAEPRFAPLWLAGVLFALSIIITGALFRYWLF